MVIKGDSVAGAKARAMHLGRKDTNERRNDVIEMRDVAATDLQGALREMEAVAAGGCPNCEKPFYHASINTRASEKLTDAQRLHAIDRLEKELGLTGQPRVVVVHEKKDGREHCHVVWSRIDLDKMRVISDSHTYRKHELVARELEREFGHERVQGAHIERDGKPRPPRTPSHKEHQQGERTGIRPKAAKELITRLWSKADNGKAFQAALEGEGWILARGDRRDFVAVDPKGGTHSLARRIEGAKAADVRARLADLNPFTLYSVPEAREVQQQRQATRASERAASREQAQAARDKAATTPPRATARHVKERAGVAPVAGAARAAGGIARGIGGSLFKALMGESSTPARAPPPDRGAPRPPDEEEKARLQAEADKGARRQKYLRNFDREVPEERQRDADLERDRTGRERSRGE